MTETRICKGRPFADGSVVNHSAASGRGRRFTLLAGCSAALAASVLLSGCAKKKEEAHAAPLRTVTSAVATAQDLPLYIDSLGRTKAFESVSIMPQVSGTLEKISFTQGTYVKKGDPLFAIDPALYRASVLQAQGALQQAQAQLHIDQLQLERSRSLLPDKLISEQEFQALEAKVEADKGAVTLAQGQLDSAQVNLGYAEIASPIDGLIGFYNVTEGNVVSAASGTVLTTIQRLDPLYVDFTVTDRQFIALRSNYDAQGSKLPVQVRYLAADNVTDEVFPAELKVLDNEINRSTGTVRLRAELPNSKRTFWPEQPVSARVILHTIKDAVSVPALAVSTGQMGTYVFTIEDKGGKQIVEQVPVKVGQFHDNGKTVVIESGLKAGQRVVLEGQVFLQSGQEVSVKTSTAAAASAATKTADSAAAAGGASAAAVAAKDAGNAAAKDAPAPAAGNAAAATPAK